MPFDIRTELPPLPSAREEAESGRKRTSSEEGAGASESITDEKKYDDDDDDDDIPLAATSIGEGRASEDPTDRERRRSEERYDMLRSYQDRTFSNHPPLNPSIAAAAVQHLISSTAGFMNTFAASVDARLRKCSERISGLEAQVGLLESKLEQISDRNVSGIIDRDFADGSR